MTQAQRELPLAEQIRLTRVSLWKRRDVVATHSSQLYGSELRVYVLEWSKPYF